MIYRADFLCRCFAGKCVFWFILTVDRVQFLPFLWLRSTLPCWLSSEDGFQLLKAFHIHSLQVVPQSPQISNCMLNSSCALRLWLPPSLSLRPRFKRLMWSDRVRLDNLAILRSTDWGNWTYIQRIPFAI